MDVLPHGPVGAAISGGSDSTALLVLLVNWARARGRAVRAVTVDHGLRPESRDEAIFVGTLCRELGVLHDRLSWDRATLTGNLQDQARRARRRLIAGWARGLGIGTVALGHTCDDQAETFLMRLARGSGVDGLAAMAPAVEADGVTWVRPLLTVPRASLRAMLESRGIGWVEDPSNTDRRFDRVRARAALEQLEPLGLGRERLVATAARMARAREALDAAAATLEAECIEWGQFGEAAVSVTPFGSALAELRMRVLAGVLCRVSGAGYRPRETSLGALCDLLSVGGIGAGTTLHGCVLRSHRGRIAIRREPGAVAPRVPASSRCWDRRWRLDTDRVWPPGAEIGAMGPEGLEQVENWRELGVAREVLLSVPGLWRDNVLLGAALPGAPAQVPFRLQDASAWRGRGHGTALLR